MMNPLQELIEILDKRIYELEKEVARCEEKGIQFSLGIARGERHGTRWAKEVALTLLSKEINSTKK